MLRRTPYLDPRLEPFPDRTEQLRAIIRYRDAYPVMFYRQNVLHHVMRVSWLANELADVAAAIFPSYDPRKAELMALVHDDAEMVTGDYQASYRTRLTEQELSNQLAEELEAIAEVARGFPATLDGYSYQELLESFATMNSPEALVAKYADKFDAFGETLHELFAGNALFNVPPLFRGQPVPAAPKFCFNLLNSFSQLYPDFQSLFGSGHPLVKLPAADFIALAQRGSLHTAETIRQPSNYGPYDAWKSVILKNASDEELADLYEQREFSA